MLLEHDRNYDLGMDALVTVCSWNTNGIMIWARMLWSPYALGTRTVPARVLGAPGAKLLVSPLISPIVVLYIIPFQEFRLYYITLNPKP